MRKYITVFDVFNMVKGIEDLMLDDDNDFLGLRYDKIKKIYEKSIMFGHVPKYCYKIVEDIDNEILKYIGVE